MGTMTDDTIDPLDAILDITDRAEQRQAIIDFNSEQNVLSKIDELNWLTILYKPVFGWRFRRVVDRRIAELCELIKLSRNHNG
jgi:hypothetical protein